MLVLSRKEGQQIRIGDSVTVSVVQISGNRVKLAIDAPAEVGIVRGELVGPDARSPESSERSASAEAAVRAVWTGPAAQPVAAGL